MMTPSLAGQKCDVNNDDHDDDDDTTDGKVSVTKNILETPIQQTTSQQTKTIERNKSNKRKETTKLATITKQQPKKLDVMPKMDDSVVIYGSHINQS
jgi:hypothetical protein